jgi:hypothetical protein
MCSRVGHTNTCVRVSLILGLEVRLERCTKSLWETNDCPQPTLPLHSKAIKKCQHLNCWRFPDEWTKEVGKKSRTVLIPHEKSSRRRIMGTGQDGKEENLSDLNLAKLTASQELFPSNGVPQILAQPQFPGRILPYPLCGSITFARQVPPFFAKVDAR